MLMEKKKWQALKLSVLAQISGVKQILDGIVK